MPLALLLLLIVVGYLIYLRTQEIFFISVRDGRMLVVRGAAPTTVLQDFGDVLERAGVKRATLRLIKTSGHAQLRTSGLDDGTEQRCRNVVGTHPIHQMRSESVSADGGNLGQLLGIAWLAWLLAPRR